MHKGMALSILAYKEQRYYDSLINLCIAGEPPIKEKARQALRECEEDLRRWTENMLNA